MDKIKKLNAIHNLINKLQSNIFCCENINIEISTSNVAWHIEHALLTINEIVNSLTKSEENHYKWKFSFLRVFIFTIKIIPRGKAKSPKLVQPKSNISSTTLENHIISTRKNLNTLLALPKHKYFQHPYFGNLKLFDAITFIEIHTKHHLHIIEDIVK